LFDGILGTPENSLYENRLIFLTDMCPNSGDGDGKTLFDMTQRNADKKLYTTFIGVGVDFNTELTSLIGKIRCCNYFTVQTSQKFKKQMSEEFDYMVTPNVFNCSIDFDTNGWEVERVFGSPGYEYPQQGRLFFMDSSFPSLKDGSNMTKGGMILVKIKKSNNNNDQNVSSAIKFTTSYDDRSGKPYSFSEPFEMKDGSEEYFETSSIRKAILLVRYVNFFKHFLRDSENNQKSPSINTTTGITIPALLSKQNRSNRNVKRLPLGEEWKLLFQKFLHYFEEEIRATGDTTLEKELKQLVTIYEPEGKGQRS